MRFPNINAWATKVRQQLWAYVSTRQEQSAGTPLTRDHIIWAYRIFLNREPESEEVITAQLQTLRSMGDLRENFLNAPEYRQMNAGFSMPEQAVVVIKEASPGFRLFVDISDYDIGLNFVLGLYERSEIEYLRSLLKTGDTILDIGANIGIITMEMAAAIGETGHVYAFEPLGRNADLLERSIAENSFGQRVTLVRAGVGETEGSMELISPNITRNWGGPYMRAAGEPIPSGHRADRVPILTLDRYPMRRPVACVKIDVEGAELLVIRGARALLVQDRPVVVAELSPAQLAKVSRCTASDLITEMAALGYRCFRLVDSGVGPQLTHYTASEIINVVFLPEETSQ